MRKITLLLATALLLGLASCSQDDTEIYSCNKEVNDWVTSNLEEIHLMKRSQWKELKPETSIPVYRAFLPSQKLCFWKEKFEEVKKLDWTDAELEHIKKVEDFMYAHTRFFDGEELDDEDLDELDAFFYGWSMEGKNQFNWSDAVPYAIACTGYTMTDTDGTLDMDESDVNAVSLKSSSKESSCNCNRKSLFSCIADPLGTCEKSISYCQGTDSGCGFLFAYKCDGTCGGI